MQDCINTLDEVAALAQRFPVPILGNDRKISVSVTRSEIETCNVINSAQVGKQRSSLAHRVSGHSRSYTARGGGLR